MKVLSVYVVLLSLLFGCGDDVAPTDAAVDAATDGGDAGMVTAPQIPWLEMGGPVALTPCPEGWRAVTDRDPVECDPYPETGRADCPAGQAHFPGEPGCTPVGSACPAGDFSDRLPADGTVIYVSASAAPGGDGSLSAPFESLSRVSWPSVRSGTVVAIGKGSYEGSLPVGAGGQVIGACAAETRLTGLAAPVPAVIITTSAGDEAIVRDLSIVGAPQGGAMVRGSHSLRLEGVVIDGTVDFGAITAAPGGQLTLAGVHVTGTRALDPSQLGIGIGAFLGGRIDAERVLITEHGQAGVMALDPGSEAYVSDIAIFDAVGVFGQFGDGLQALDGGRIEATRVIMDGNSTGVAVIANSEAVLTDAVVRNTVTINANFGGRGVEVQDASQLTATRLVVADFPLGGIFLYGPTTRGVFEDLVVRDARGRDRDGAAGRGISASQSAHLEADRLAIVRAREVAVFASLEGSMTLRDLLVVDTTERLSDGVGGYAINAIEQGRVEVERALVQRAHGLGAIADEGATLTFSDVIVRETLHAEARPIGGHAIVVQSNSVGDFRRVRVESCSTVGIGALGGTATLEDIVVTGVTSASTGDFGYGISATDGDLTIRRFLVDDIALCGLFIGTEGLRPEPPTLTAREGTVSGSIIGACVQVDGYDLDLLSTDVSYLDNGVNLDTTSLPVPAPADPLGDL